MPAVPSHTQAGERPRNHPSRPALQCKSADSIDRALHEYDYGGTFSRHDAHTTSAAKRLNRPIRRSLLPAPSSGSANQRGGRDNITVIVAAFRAMG
jgi:hypothetical protein